MDSLLQASDFVQTVEQLQGIMISAPEEIAYINKWISKEELIESAKKYGNLTKTCYNNDRNIENFTPSFASRRVFGIRAV